MTRSILVPVSGMAILLALLYVPVFLDLARLWWTDANYSHGFLVPFIAGYLIWNRRQEIIQTRTQPSAWGIPVLFVGLFLLLAGKGVEIAGGAYGVLFLKGTSFVLVCTGTILLLAGKPWLKMVSFPLVYLLFMVPLPDGLFTMVTLPLQEYATRVTVSVLHLLRIPALREGHLIHLPFLTLGVVEACSGIRSLITLLAGTVVLSYLTMTRGWQHVILIGSVMPIAIVTNAFRITATGVLAYYWGAQVAEGFFHGFSGWLLLLIASLFLCTEVVVLLGLPNSTEAEVAA